MSMKLFGPDRWSDYSIDADTLTDSSDSNFGGFLDGNGFAVLILGAGAAIALGFLN